jgi:hypothetical protein
MGTKIRWTAVGAAVAFAIAATAAVATGELGGNDRLQACAKTENGQLRLVAAASDCLQSETAVSWPASVPAGSGTSFTTVTASVPPGPGVTSATATCAAGSRVVGGGGNANPVASGNVIATYPPDGASWTVAAALNPTSAQSLSVYAICAS